MAVKPPVHHTKTNPARSSSGRGFSFFDSDLCSSSPCILPLLHHRNLLSLSLDDRICHFDNLRPRTCLQRGFSHEHSSFMMRDHFADESSVKVRAGFSAQVLHHAFHHAVHGHSGVVCHNGAVWHDMRVVRHCPARFYDRRWCHCANTRVHEADYTSEYNTPNCDANQFVFVHYFFLEL